MNNQNTKTRKQLIDELAEIEDIILVAEDSENKELRKRWAPVAAKLRAELIERYGDDYHMFGAL